jgi:class 3 adenylate cyclase
MSTGSTRRWEADAEAMAAALAAHDSVLRSAIDAHGGFLFKHTGDANYAYDQVDQARAQLNAVSK